MASRCLSLSTRTVTGVHFEDDVGIPAGASCARISAVDTVSNDDDVAEIILRSPALRRSKQTDDDGNARIQRGKQ